MEQDQKEYAREKARKKAHNWYVANKERAAIYAREYRLRKMEELRTKRAAYYVANRERIRATQNASYDPIKTMERTKAWRKANPEKYKELYTRGMNKRRALKITTSVGKVDYNLIREQSGMICGICKSPVEGKFEYDHIIPLSKGGSHTTDNHQLTHPSCNRKKAAKVTFGDRLDN